MNTKDPKTVFIDEVEVNNLSINVDFSFGEENEGTPNDCGVVCANFTLDGKEYEYCENFNTETGKVDTQNCMFPNSGSENGEILNEKLFEIKFGMKKGHNFIPNLNYLIEVEIERLKQVLRFESELSVLNINQKEFCEKMNITTQCVSKWKKKGKFPNHVWYALVGMRHLSLD